MRRPSNLQRLAVVSLTMLLASGATAMAQGVPARQHGTTTAPMASPGGTTNRSQTSTVADMAPGATINQHGTVTHLIGPGLPPVGANQSIKDVHTPVFQVAGFGGYVTAPVVPAYDADNNFRTFAGQPGRGATAVLQQGMYGSP